MAFAERPEGPYVDLGRPLLRDPHWAIDAPRGGTGETWGQRALGHVGRLGSQGKVTVSGGRAKKL